MANNILTPDDALTEFYRRNLLSRTDTGIPREFRVTSDSQQFDAKSIKYPEGPKATLSSPNVVSMVPPTIQSFYPYWGYVNGGEVVDIYGHDFLQGCLMRFVSSDYNNVIYRPVTFFDQGHIQVVTPAYWNSPILGGYDLTSVEVSNVNPWDDGLANSLGNFQFELTPTSADLNGVAQGGFAGTVSGQVKWPMNVYNSSAGGAYPFIGFFRAWVYPVGGSRSGSGVLLFMLNGSMTVTINGTGGPADFNVEFLVDGSNPPVSFSWQYSVA